MLVKLAWRNLWRNKRRSVITISAIVFAVVLSVLLDSVKKGLLDKMKENVVGFYHGYVQVHRNGYWKDQTLDNSFDYDTLLTASLHQRRGVEQVIPRLESFVLAASESRSKGSMLVGIHPEKENAVTALKSKLIAGDYLQLGDRGVMITEGLADYLKLGLNDSLVVLGQGYHGVSAAGKYPIRGLIKFGSPELNKGLIYLSIWESQHLFGADNKVTALVLKLKDIEEAQLTARELGDALDEEFEIMSWQQLLPELDQVIQGEEAENIIFQAVLYILIAFGIFGTVLMMTMERKFEFGVLVAIGMKKGKLSLVVVLENVLLSVLGALVGILVSLPIVIYLYKFPISLSGQLAEAYENFGMEPIYYFSTDAVVFYTQGLIVLSLALVLAFYPILRIWKLNPVEAMQS